MKTPRPSPSTVLVACALLLSSGCSGSGRVPPDPSMQQGIVVVCQPCPDAMPASTPTAKPVAPTEPVSTVPSAVEARAEEITSRARQIEPLVTRKVEELAAAVGGRLIGLEHRLKSKKSTISKIERLVKEDPDTPASEVIVWDALRYTFLIPDEPEDHHVASVRSILADLESHGHTMHQVKNYWPRGDTYSGINTVILSRMGVHLEIQFHTPASFAIKQFTHDDYDKMRDPATPIEEQRALFQRQADIWDDIRIPKGMLEPGSIHEKAVLRKIPPP